MRVGCMHVSVLRRPAEQRIPFSPITAGVYDMAMGTSHPLASRVRVGIQTSRLRGPSTYVELPTTGTSTCPVRAMRVYHQAGAAADGAPLFTLDSGAVLTRRSLNNTFRLALGPGFSSHSLRNGLAKTGKTVTGFDEKRC